ncbi:MAG: twin-arginine translocation signal domain-containing protein [Candidatus Micrarchaeota archaeon]
MTISRRDFLKGASAALLLAACSPKLLAKQPPTFSVPTSEGNKRIKLHFQFGPHETSSDAEQIVPSLRDFKPHVVCIETAASTESDSLLIENLYNTLDAIDSGDIFDCAFKQALSSHAPNAKIFVLERFKNAKDSDDIYEAHNRAMQLKDESMLAMRRNPKRALALHRKGLQLEAETNVAREKEAKRVLSDFYSHLIARHPSLKAEKELRVVVQYGAAHTALFAKAKKMGFAATSRTLATPDYFPPNVAFIRKATFGLPLKLSDEETARSLVSGILFSLALAAGANSENSAAFGNTAAKLVTLGKFGRICEDLKDPHPYISYTEALRRNGLVVPQSAGEVNTFLQKRRIPLARERE